MRALWSLSASSLNPVKLDDENSAGELKEGHFLLHSALHMLGGYEQADLLQAVIGLVVSVDIVCSKARGQPT